MEQMFFGATREALKERTVMVHEDQVHDDQDHETRPIRICDNSNEKNLGTKQDYVKRLSVLSKIFVYCEKNIFDVK